MGSLLRNPDDLALALLLFGVAAVGAMVFRSWPRLGLVTWLLALSFIPIWLGVSAVLYWMPAVAVGLLLLAALLGQSRFEMTAADLGVLAFFVACLASFALPGSWKLSNMVQVVTEWILGFLIGRLILRRVPYAWVLGAIAVVLSLVAALAVLEFILAWNPFIQIPGSHGSSLTWGGLNSRGSFLRAEGAWGHPIALGAALTMAIPIALAAPLSVRIRLAMVVVLLAGASVTFSRSAVVAGVLAVILSMWSLRREVPGSLKSGLLIVCVLFAVVLVPFATALYAEDQENLEVSGSYRGQLLDLLPYVEPLGLSDQANRGVSWDKVYDGFKSVDNALLGLGLTHGWIPVLIAFALLGAVLICVIRREAEAPTIAVASQIPTLFVSALITQLSVYFWFMVGLSVAAQEMSRRARGPNQRASDSSDELEVAMESALGRQGVVD